MNYKLKAELPKRKNPRLKDFDYSQPYAYFLTICSRNKENLFCNPDLNFEMLNCLKLEKMEKGIAIYAYCLMPDHLHLLISPLESTFNVSKFIGGFKSKTTRLAWKYGLKGRIWQDRFYDHIVRRIETLRKTCEYILNNPVRKGLVEKSEDYQFSGLIDSIYI
jgi:putative transposase